MRWLKTLAAIMLSTAPIAAAPREFRAVWVATVANIDWPSRPGLSAEQQKKELVALFDTCKELNLNCVIFQVRPMCDALYESTLEPWSGYLTGTPGKSPGYDPLALAVELAHARKIELHVWLNPYRAWHPSAQGEVPSNHLVKAKPEIAKKYGKHYWLNPTHPETRRHTIAVVKDIVSRYDIDGVHMDDYFYPYPELDDQKREIPFPDDDTWADYQKTGGKLPRDDWRRDAVNQFVKSLNDETHKMKPWVKVGISPFGIWRPGHPSTIKGFDQYAKLYADAKLWLNEGWIDYWTPQLYWVIDKPDQSYPVLLNWWANENTKKRHLWPGNYTGRHSASEIGRQIDLTRSSGTATGNVHFSFKSLTGEKYDMLKARYAEPAEIPECDWLGKRPK